VPPYFGASSLLTFIGFAIFLMINRESLNPRTLNDLSIIDPTILEFFANALGEEIEQVKNLKVETALANFYVNNNGLFYRPIRFNATPVDATTHLSFPLR
jgi:hypothetical protein